MSWGGKRKGAGRKPTRYFRWDPKFEWQYWGPRNWRWVRLGEDIYIIELPVPNAVRDSFRLPKAVIDSLKGK